MSSEGGEAARVEPKRTPPRWLVRSLKVLAGTALGLALVEGTFWWLDSGAFPHLNVYEADAELGVRLRPGATERTRVEPNPVTKVRVNEHGLRGAALALPMTNAVLVVGDSTTFGLGVEEDETFSARLAATLRGRPVVNAGIPTYGPLEYQRVAERLLPVTRAKTLVYAVNLANDLFEAARPNRERHKVWDGWAVRAPTAPLEVSSFPGRSWLFRESHAFFHLRKLVYRARHPELEDVGFDTEGSWRDLVREARESEVELRARQRRGEARAKSYAGDVSYAERHFELADEDIVRALYSEFTGKDGEQSVRIRLARATPGDIVAPAPGEEAEPVKASVGQIRDGARFRLELEKKLRERAALKACRETDRRCVRRRPAAPFRSVVPRGRDSPLVEPPREAPGGSAKTRRTLGRRARHFGSAAQRRGVAGRVEKIRGRADGSHVARRVSSRHSRARSRSRRACPRRDGRLASRRTRGVSRSRSPHDAEGAPCRRQGAGEDARRTPAASLRPEARARALVAPDGRRIRLTRKSSRCAVRAPRTARPAGFASGSECAARRRRRHGRNPRGRASFAAVTAMR